MKQLLILAFLSCLCLSALAQSDSSLVDLSRPFICLFDGKLIAANEIIYEEKLIKKSYLSVDGKRYETKQIKFYNTPDGFYANSSKYFSGDFIKRIHEGNANVFVFNSSIDRTNTQPGGYTTVKSTNISTYFYNIGFGDLKKVKYANLKLDLSDNAQAMAHLKKYKNTRSIKRGLLIGGVAMVLSTTLVGESPIGAGLAFTGTTAILTGVFWGMNRDKHLYRSLEVYNGNSFAF